MIPVDMAMRSKTDSELYKIASNHTDDGCHSASFILMERVSVLETKDMCIWYGKAIPELKTSIMDAFCQYLNRFSQLELIFLSKEAALISHPRFFQIVERLWTNENLRSEQTNYAISVPDQFTCYPPAPVREGGFLHFFSKKKSEEKPSDKTPEKAKKPEKYYEVQISGPKYFNQAQEKPTLGVVMLDYPSRKNSGHGAALYMKRASSQDYTILGVLTPENPKYHIDLNALRITSYDEAINLRIYEKPLALIVQEIQAAHQKQTTEPSTTISSVVPPSPSQQPSQLIVCLGEIHEFTVQPNENIESLKARSSARWRLNSKQYELMDSNFMSLDDKTLLSSIKFNPAGVLFMRQTTSAQSPFPTNNAINFPPTRNPNDGAPIPFNLGDNKFKAQDAGFKFNF
eukprot:TRINITY_DN590_c6_g1_i1.p1 TRINITY_DN590_c6_g1~~TRINITY_DN590_c6_g1_i1.p1  ORF type:complete len:401 (+),score=85.07 TRINITY_DN590_c6_g1_i1:32-1234(+)